MEGNMSDEPSYLDLLNRISVGESEAERLLDCWASTTPDPAVRKVLTTIALREGEHGKAFAKRICELGYSVTPSDTGDTAGRMAIAASRDLTDREKFEKLNVTSFFRADAPDVFTPMWADTTIDIQTGALLGRYIAEERDSLRMLEGCYNELCASEDGSSAVNAGLAASLGRIEQLLEQLVAKTGN
jgi:rubrerythrin